MPNDDATWLQIDHVQLGIAKVPKPGSLADQGGRRFESGPMRLHLVQG